MKPCEPGAPATTGTRKLVSRWRAQAGTAWRSAARRGGRLAGAVILLWAPGVAAGSTPGIERLPLGIAAGRFAVSAEAGSHVGPWGRLDLSVAYLEAPGSAIESAPKPDQRPVWYFPGADLAFVRGVLRAAELPETTIAAWLAADRCRVGRDGITLLPAVEAVVDLPPGARQVIYEVLARSPLNPYHHVPQLIFGDHEEWLAGSRLAEPQKRTWRKLLWRKGGVSAFSDLSVLIQLATSSQEIDHARSFMTRVRTIRASVRPGEGASGEMFVEYWSARQRNAESVPLLRALVERGSDKGSEVVLLLPALCRERLYTYPLLGDAVGGRFPDCNWTSLNFFSDRPRPYYLDAKSAYLELTQNYERIAAPAQLGDLICCVNEAGAVLHSCVYIAADIVFTKNGQTPLAPWVLMRLPEVFAAYNDGEVRYAVFFRPKVEGAQR